MELGPLNPAFDDVRRTRWLEMSVFGDIGRSICDSVGRTRRLGRSTFDDVGRTRWLTNNLLSRGLEMPVNVLSRNCVVGLIRCVEVVAIL